MGEEPAGGLLAKVEIDNGHPRPLMEQGSSQMHSDGRLTRTALLVADDDHPRLGQRKCPIHK